MNNDDDALSSVYKKIERERALLNAANQMRQQTQNETVRSRIDTQMREGRRNIQYLEERMQELQMRRMGQGVDNLSLGPANGLPRTPEEVILKLAQTGEGMAPKTIVRLVVMAI
jgi:hypothetical protein